MATKEASPPPMLRISAYQAFKAGFFAMLGVLVANLILGVGALILFMIPMGLSLSERLTSLKPTSSLQATEPSPIPASYQPKAVQAQKSDRRQ